MLDVEWTKYMNRKFANKLGHEMENGNSTSNIPLLRHLSTLPIAVYLDILVFCGKNTDSTIPPSRFCLSAFEQIRL